MFFGFNACFFLLTLATSVSVLACQPATIANDATPEQIKVGLAAVAAPPQPIPLPPDVEAVTVTRVEAADTLQVLSPNLGLESIKLLGVELPESMTPGKPIACFGAEAFANTRAKFEGKSVYLEKDPLTTD